MSLVSLTVHLVDPAWAFGIFLPTPATSQHDKMAAGEIAQG